MNVPTAKEFYRQAINDETIGDDITDLMNAYAKLHVEAALEAALDSIPCLGSSSDIATYEEVEKEVLNSYPLTNIK